MNRAANPSSSPAISADAKDGVLTVHLPKTKAATAKTVEVKVQ